MPPIHLQPRISSRWPSLNRDRTAYLIEVDDEDELAGWLAHHQELLEEELIGWYTDPALSPRKRSVKMLQE
jgi:hypothetical protein